jgi:hypothetical protein
VVELHQIGELGYPHGTVRIGDVTEDAMTGRIAEGSCLGLDPGLLASAHYISYGSRGVTTLL